MIALFPPLRHEHQFHTLQPMPSLPLSARLGDPVVDAIARSIFTLFPRCMVCGQPIARFEDADVRILSQRVVHREPCTPTQPRSSAVGP